MRAPALLPLGQTLLDGVLVRAAERGEDQLARVRLAGRNRHAGAALIDFTHRVQIAEVELRVNAVHVEVQRHGDEVEVAGALAVAEERALDAVRAGEQAQFRGGGAGVAVVVRVQADDERVAIADVRAHPLDLVRVNIRHRHLDRVGQIQNHPPLRRGLPHVHDRLGDFLGILDLGGGEALGRILERYVRADEAVEPVFDELRPVDGDGLDFILRLAEHHAALRGRGRVIHVDDHPLRADKRLEGFLDEVLARLHEHLDGHVVGDEALLDEQPVEGELSVRRGREADLDLLEAALHERLKQLELLRDVHRHCEGLIAIAQVHAAPERRMRERAAGPLTVGQVDAGERAVF